MRKVLASSLIVVVAMLIAADWLLPRVISAQLPGLLTRTTEKQVFLGQVEVDLLSLRVRLAQLRIGDADNPALVVDNLEVELDGAKLLRGQLGLHLIGAQMARFDVKSWQGEGKKGEEGDQGSIDRALINRWLPVHADIDTLAIYSGGERLSLTQDNRWQRLDAQRQLLTWTQAGLLSPLSVRLEFSPVFELLEEQRGHGRLEVVRVDSPSDVLSVEVDVRATAQGVQQTIEVDTLALAGRWRFVTDEFLKWPETSELTLQILDFDEIQEVVGAALETADGEPSDWLLSPLPVVNLPHHDLMLTIGELTVADETTTDIAAQVSLRAATAESASRIELRSFFASLPNSDLTGLVTATVGEQWQMTLAMKAASQDREAGLAVLYEDSDWRWQQGKADLTTHGSTALALFENTRGLFEGRGMYAKEALPLYLHAEFKSDLGLLGADSLELRIGQSIVTGSLWTDDARRALYARLVSPYLDIDELLGGRGDDAPVTDEITIPDLQWIPSDLPIDIEFSATTLNFGGYQLENVAIAFNHGAEQAILDLAFSIGETGSVEVAAVAHRLDAKRTLQLDLNAENVDLAGLGLVPGVNVVAAHLSLAGEGINLPAIVSALVGEMDLRISSNTLNEDVWLQASPSFRLLGDKLVDVTLAELKTRLGETPLVDGQLSLDVVAPSLSGRLHAEKLNLDGLLEQSTPREDSPIPVDELASLPVTNFNLNVQQLTVQGKQLSNAGVTMMTSPGQIEFSDLTFSSTYGEIQGAGVLKEEQGIVDLSFSGTLAGLRVSTLTEGELADLIEAPLDGEITLRSQSQSLLGLGEEPILGLRLAERGNSGDAHAFNIEVYLRPLLDGIEATLGSVNWRGSDAKGRLIYRATELPQLTVDLTAKHIDLSSFQVGPATTDAPDTKNTLVGSLAKTTGQVLSFFSGQVLDRVAVNGAQTNQSDRVFDQESWPLNLLNATRVDFDLHADSLKTKRGSAREVGLQVNFGSGQLAINLDSENANGGPLQVEFSYDTTVLPPIAQLRASLENVRLNPGLDTPPVTLFADIGASGRSESSIAATLHGQIYIAAGRGKIQIANLGDGLLTGDLVQNLIRMLVPKAEQIPRLSCAVGYGDLVNGKLETPAALVIQTGKANILMRIRADLGQEIISAQMDSRSRTGTGLSLGNVFSNTVRLEGPLSAPQIVPNTKNLLWRYGAAVASGGLTLIGESLYKRLMIDPDPCASMTVVLREKICVGATPAASSPLVCP